VPPAHDPTSFAYVMGWAPAPHAYGGCSSLLFADKAKPICEAQYRMAYAQIGGELIKMHGLVL